MKPLAFFRLMRETRCQEHILLHVGNKGVNKLFTQNGIRLHYYKFLVVMIEFRFLKRLSAGKNRPLHGFRRHLGCGAVAAKITANIWKILQLSTVIISQLHVQF